jgi:DNA-binding MarR family transcriptional regulator
MPRNRDPSLEDLARSIELEVREITQALRRPLEAEYARGQLTAPQRIVMQTLVHSEGMSLKELCARVALSHSTVSGIVDRLQSRGLIERSTDAIDRRLTCIRVTSLVREFMRDRAPRLTAQPLLDALSRLSPAERRVAARGLSVLRNALNPGAVED